jgi:hypothetical protein
MIQVTDRPTACTLDEMSLPAHIVVRPPTIGPWFDQPRAEEFRKTAFPLTAAQSPTVFVLDLNDVYPWANVLDTYLVTLAREVREGFHGQVSLVVKTMNTVLRQQVEMLAHINNVPLFLAAVTAPLEISESKPVGLAPSDRQTIDVVGDLGGRVTAAVVAERLGLQHTAALNRLNGLVLKGYLHRLRRPGRTADLFVDPRFPSLEETAERILEATANQLSPAEQAKLQESLARTTDATVEADNGPSYY